ncbi:MAG: cytochrome c [Verrucomicrobia bacterium]|nr:cytochrome c [Verrucomicrobiota bacterium]
MRELIARLVCWMSLAAVVAFAGLFAFLHNRPVPAAASGAAPLPAVAARAAPVPPPANGDRGRAVYERENCATCHSLGGEGNPRRPLDGVGVRRSGAELREWITGTGAAASSLSASVTRRKRAYLELSEADLGALSDYLAAPRTGK